jgi:hypothetical protein
MNSGRRIAVCSLLFLSWLACAFCAHAWPQCRVLSGKAGAPAIVVDGQVRSPLFLSLNNQFGRDDALLSELSHAAEVELPFFTVNIDLPWIAPDEKADGVLDTFCAAHPQGYFLVRLWLGPPPGWLADHADACVQTSAGERLNYVSPASGLWRDAAADQLRARLDHILKCPHGDHFLGVQLGMLQTTEWFYPVDKGYVDYSPVNRDAFRAWLRKAYRSEKNLRKAWDDSSATFDAAALPSPDEREAAAWGPFRDPKKQRRAMDMERFQSELVVDTIAHFARIVKEVSEGRSLAGVFYGYTMELNGNGPTAIAQSGHLALARLLENKDIDLIFSPYSYFERAAGQPGHFHLPVDSVSLHNKLVVIEDDTYTHLSRPPDPQLIAPGWNDRAKTVEETLAISERNIGNALTHRCGLWWFDLLSDGRWDFPEFWKMAPVYRRIAAEVRGAGPFRPEVAVAIDERALRDLRTAAPPLLIQSLYWWRSELDRIGTPVGYYLQSDLSKLPDSVKVLILPTAFELDKAARKAVQKLWKRGGTVVWCYAPDLVGPDGPDPARIQKSTGFNVEARFDETPIHIVDAFTKERFEVDASPWKPRFVLPGPESDVLARYADTDEICAAAHQAGKGVAIYTAVPRLPLSLMRLIVQRSGVQFHRDTPGMTGIAGNYLFLHGSDSEEIVHFSRLAPSSGLLRILPPATRPMFLDKKGIAADQVLPKTTNIYRFED